MSKQRVRSRTEIDKALPMMLTGRGGFKDFAPNDSDMVRDVLNWVSGEAGTAFGKRLGEGVAVDAESDK